MITQVINNGNLGDKLKSLGFNYIPDEKSIT